MPTAVDKNDPLTHFAPLLAVLEAAPTGDDYDSPVVGLAIAYGVQSARAAGVPPAAVLARLRTHLNGAPLAHVDWDRAMVVDHVVLRRVEAYFDGMTAAP